MLDDDETEKASLRVRNDRNEIKLWTVLKDITYNNNMDRIVAGLNLLPRNGNEHHKETATRAMVVVNNSIKDVVTSKRMSERAANAQRYPDGIVRKKHYHSIDTIASTLG